MVNLEFLRELIGVETAVYKVELEWLILEVDMLRFLDRLRFVDEFKYLDDESVLDCYLSLW